jgi:hypothetical protein
MKVGILSASGAILEITGAALSLIAGTNLFSEYIANETAALFVTALAVGGGSNLLYQIFGSERPSS